MKQIYVRQLLLHKYCTQQLTIGAKFYSYKILCIVKALVMLELFNPSLTVSICCQLILILPQPIVIFIVYAPLCTFMLNCSL